MNRIDRKWGMMVAALTALLVLSGCGVATTTPSGAQGVVRQQTATTHSHSANTGEVNFPHIHGLGFSKDGRQLIVPAHDGFRFYQDGAWQVPDLPVNDYMGYAATDTGFYSSGHPGPGVKLPNPLGLVKSTDGGQTLTTLGFEGQSDFHLMGVGYHNHAIYLLNPAANARLAPGLYYSLDDGKQWQQSTAQGVPSQPIQIAVHPKEPNIVALATEGGLLLSTNYGASFERVGSGIVTTTAFSPDGTTLFFGSTMLSSYNLELKKISELQVPQLPGEDVYGYVAVNPAQPEEMALASFGRNIFVSKDSGKTWKQIARDGQAT